jgi:ABC-type polysaccharide/polyol phosphate export permease
MAGIVLNSFFNQGLMISAESIASNAGVLTKIYVPPQVFPISVALAGLVNFFIGLIPLAIVVYISSQSLALTFPLVIIVGFFLALLVAGLGLALSLLFIRFDDTKNIVGVTLLILFYITPVLYPISILSERMQNIVKLNPLTSYLDCFRWAFSNNAVATLNDWLYMGTTGILAILFGTYMFKKFWPRTVAML